MSVNGDALSSCPQPRAEGHSGGVRPLTTGLRGFHRTSLPSPEMGLLSLTGWMAALIPCSPALERPFFGTQGEKARRCEAHAEPGMVNVGPRYGLRIRANIPTER